MQRVANGKVRTLPHQTILSVKLILLLLTIASLQVSARIEAQSISFSVKDAPLEKVILLIEKQTAFRFVYSQQAMAASKTISLTVKDETVNNLLKLVFREQPLSYSISENYIILRLNPVKEQIAPSPDLKGKVINDEGLPVPGITVSVKGSGRSVVTDASGEFYLDKIEPGSTLIISGAETAPKEVKVEGRDQITITISTRIAELDQVVMTAYGTTTKKINTGNITKVTSREIERQPVSNPLAALQGRVPGMIVTQSSGIPGSAFKVEIRGRSALDLSYSRNDPLFIIDGVPFEPGNMPTNQIVNATNKPNNVEQGGLSALNSINPADIESIEVLKDADATAIYGSRGANGVILITTKKGSSGKLKLNVNASSGWSKVTRTMDMLNTTQYLAMRREAFKNDGVTPTVINAPDLLSWDTTQFTDYKKMFQGQTANQQNAQISLSGGSSSTQFRIGMGYNSQSNIFSDDMNDKIISGHFNISHNADEARLKLTFSGGYSVDNNKLLRDDLTRYKNLPPHIQLTDAAGNLIWNAGGVDYTTLIGPGNPLALLLRKYNSENKNLYSNFTLAYSVLKRLNIKINFGYNTFSTDEVSILPRRSFAPNVSTSGSSFFANRHSTSWITEPQADHTTRFGKTEMKILVGGTLQERVVKTNAITASNYSNDALLNSVAAAGTVTATNDYQQYRYAAAFSRISFNHSDKYLANLSYRVDGSSRFGPEKRFASFGAIGIGWIFSKEKFFGFANRFLSFGKLRASYGITGNDQIGDYKYLDLWSNTLVSYQGTPGLAPSNLFNPDYNWERNRKMEAGLELGFLKDRILLSASWYRNRSSNQLTVYRLPSQAGFSGVVKNLDALVENSGLECVLSYKTKGKLSYTGSLNFSVTRNKLIAFPNLALSSYATAYQVGRSLSSFRGYRFASVNDSSGLYTFTDVNKDGVVNSRDIDFVGNTDPRLYGGLQHEIKWKNFELAIFFEFKIQRGQNFLARITTDYPGRLSNQPVAVLARWQRRGDLASMQRFTQNPSGAAVTAYNNFVNSDGVYTDASFVRCKNLSLSYGIPSRVLDKIKLTQCRLFVNCQNLFVLTGYHGADPETQDFFVLPPLRTIVAGININF